MDEIPQTEEQSDTNPVTNLTFDQIIDNPELLQKLQQIGFSTPTEVQAAGIPVALTGKDLLIQAQTGSGKTLAFGIPLLAKLAAAEAEEPINYTYALVLTPTRELAGQVAEALSQLTDIKPAVLIGGVDLAPQIKALSDDPRVVVGTPGRILDLVRQKKLRLNRCRYFALDEADEMLSMGFIEDIRTILSRLPDKRQGLFVSATITGRVEMLAHSFLDKPERIIVGQYHTDIPAIEHLYCEVGGDLMAKPSALCDLIETMRPRSAIIFCNTKSDTQLVEALLRRRGFDARRINSDLTQAKRDRIMRKIRAGDLQILVATDIAARGLDIEQIDLVINYTIHDQAETYIHRTGRTGRAGRSGKAISLVGPRDHGAFHFLKKVVNFEFQKLPLPTEEDITEARLTHLHELIRGLDVKVGERDALVATKLLKDLGDIDEPTEELTAAVAKLTRFIVEHSIRAEAKSLDEELDGGEEEESPRKRREKSSRGSRDSKDEKRGKDRGERKERSKGRSGEQSDRQAAERGRGRDKRGSKNEGRRDYTEDNRNEEREPIEVRLYIGQGTAEGMTPQLFTDLALELADVGSSDLRKLTLREHYGFVDLHQPQAERLTENLNGIEYNGQALPIEPAANLTPQPHRRRRHGGRGRRPQR